MVTGLRVLVESTALFFWIGSVFAVIGFAEIPRFDFRFFFPFTNFLPRFLGRS